ncbi:flagellin N-terminal helical domain-containing protein [Marinobacterium weihaiense]|uniref:Flagellin n=1 Tax=Marinobacterium weihaiense TaxID=2851016 RepID=A0ABS6MCL8_9GAMM|nr:flagellin [Marinobacterium weihaiense]MBV0934048.1 flagellar biosynthesis protein FliC [Marinobacterium weihaiense]
MAMVINSNIMSLNAQNQLTKSQNDLNTSMERLTSSKRINSAADDAAGLAIANRMTSQIRGLDQAVRNANDGQALIQTAEGALDETTNILQRMRELSVQSANGTYDSGNRATLNAEVSQLQEELTRIADTTSFNGQKLLDGSLGELKLQVGADANQTISAEIGKLDAKGLGGSSADVIGTASSASLADGLGAISDSTDATTMKINGQSVGNLTDGATGSSSLQSKLDAINSRISGVEVGAFTELEGKSGDSVTGVITGSNVLEIKLVGPGAENNQLQITDTGSMEELVDKINEQGGGMLKASLNDEGGLVLSSETGAQITVTASDASVAAGLTDDNATDKVQNAQLTFTITDPSVENVDIELGTTAVHAAAIGATIGLQERDGADITGFSTGGGATLAAQELVINGVAIGAAETGTGVSTIAANNVAAINAKSAETGVVASVADDESITLHSVSGDEISISYGDAATAETNVKAIGFLETNTAESAGNSVADIDISTAAGAQKAIGILDDALEQVNSVRGDLGAISNRLDYTMNNLSNISENQAAARSRIEDADFAKESANLSRAQVLQQAGSAMLAQANAAPQQVLSLLQ